MRDEGRHANGKTTAGAMLATNGISYLSLSDVIRDEAKRRRRTEERENLIALRELEVSLARPSWDQCFGDIARQVAARSNCMKRQVAAVVGSDRCIIGTG